MKILLLTLRVPYPLTDGGAIAMYRLMEALHRAGHELHILALNTRKHHQDPAVLERFGKVSTTQLDTTPSAPAAVSNLLFSRLPYNIARFLSEEHALRLQKILETEQFDVIQLEGVYLGLYLPLIRANTKAPILLRAHNVEYEIWAEMARTEKHAFKKLYYRHLAKRGRRFERATVPEFDGVAAISPLDAEAFRKMGFKGELRDIPSGVPLADLSKPQDAKEELPSGLASLGSLEWRPNVQGLRWFLDEVWPLVQEAHPRASFHIAGKNPPPEVLEWKVPGVTIQGPVPDAAAFLRRFPLTVVPLLSGSGIRIKILEAMGLERAVVTTTRGAKGLRITPEEHFLLADTPAEFAQSIGYLLANPDFRAKMAKRARQHVEASYSWPSVVAAFEELYNALISKG